MKHAKENNEVKVRKNNIIIELDDDNQLVIKLDENGIIDRAFFIYEKKYVPAEECQRYEGVRYLSIGSIVVNEYNSYCICYKDSSNRTVCYGYPPGTKC